MPQFPKDYTSRIHSNQYNNYMTAHCPTEVSLAVQYLKKAENQTRIVFYYPGDDKTRCLAVIKKITYYRLSSCEQKLSLLFFKAIAKFPPTLPPLLFQSIDKYHQTRLLGRHTRQSYCRHLFFPSFPLGVSDSSFFATSANNFACLSCQKLCSYTAFTIIFEGGLQYTSTFSVDFCSVK